jgi:Uma2 family endonuclease
MTVEVEALEELEELEGDGEYMATLEHDLVAGNIYTALRNFLDDKDLGLAFGGSTEYRFLQPPDSEPGKKPGKQPDVSFISKGKLPRRFRSYPDVVPDLVVEVSSPTDKEYAIEAKVALYQQHQVMLIWVAHPYSRRIAVYRLASGLDPESVSEGKELSGENVIPGFKLAVSQIFNYPPDPDPMPDPKPKSRKGNKAN